MQHKQYRIDRFFGIDTSQDENFINSGYATSAKNINTDDGNLAVARGFSRFSRQPVPGADAVHRCVLFRQNGVDMYIVFAGTKIYAYFGGIWTEVHDYEALSDYSFDFAEARINSQDCLIIANGGGQLLKFDGSTVSAFGNSENVSNHPVRYLAMYKSRLFAAGDSNYPNRLYWSKLPGDTRSIEDWGYDEASPNVEGGHLEVGLFDSDPIVGIVALSSQLLIFKKSGLYRLYGDKPSNFTLEQVESNMPQCAHTSVIAKGDIAYFMTNEGLFVFDGVGVHISHDARCISSIMKKVDTSDCRGVYTRTKLYFSAVMNDEDIIIEYDLQRHTYMLRDGFAVADIFAVDNKLNIISTSRFICRFDDSLTYDGGLICAEWTGPKRDLGEKQLIKHIRGMYLRGGNENNPALLIDVTVGGVTRTYRVNSFDEEITELPLLGEGRVFGLKFYNEAGSTFKLTGGVELELSLRT